MVELERDNETKENNREIKRTTEVRQKMAKKKTSDQIWREGTMRTGVEKWNQEAKGNWRYILLTIVVITVAVLATWVRRGYLGG